MERMVKEKSNTPRYTKPDSGIVHTGSNRIRKDPIWIQPGSRPDSD